MLLFRNLTTLTLAANPMTDIEYATVRNIIPTLVCLDDKLIKANIPHSDYYKLTYNNSQLQSLFIDTTVSTEFNLSKPLSASYKSTTDRTSSPHSPTGARSLSPSTPTRATGDRSPVSNKSQSRPLQLAHHILVGDDDDAPDSHGKRRGTSSSSALPWRNPPKIAPKMLSRQTQLNLAQTISPSNQHTFDRPVRDPETVQRTETNLGPVTPPTRTSRSHLSLLIDEPASSTSPIHSPLSSSQRLSRPNTPYKPNLTTLTLSGSAHSTLNMLSQSSRLGDQLSTLQWIDPDIRLLCEVGNEVVNDYKGDVPAIRRDYSHLLSSHINDSLLPAHSQKGHHYGPSRTPETSTPVRKHRRALLSPYRKPSNRTPRSPREPWALTSPVDTPSPSSKNKLKSKISQGSSFFSIPAAASPMAASPSPRSRRQSSPRPIAIASLLAADVKFIKCSSSYTRPSSARSSPEATSRHLLVEESLQELLYPVHIDEGGDGPANSANAEGLLNAADQQRTSKSNSEMETRAYTSTIATPAIDSESTNRLVSPSEPSGSSKSVASTPRRLSSKIPSYTRTQLPSSSSLVDHEISLVEKAPLPQLAAVKPFSDTHAALVTASQLILDRLQGVSPQHTQAHHYKITDHMKDSTTTAPPITVDINSDSLLNTARTVDTDYLMSPGASSSKGGPLHTLPLPLTIEAGIEHAPTPVAAVVEKVVVSGGMLSPSQRAALIRSM